MVRTSGSVVGSSMHPVKRFAQSTNKGSVHHKYYKTDKKNLIQCVCSVVIELRCILRYIYIYIHKHLCNSSAINPTFAKLLHFQVLLTSER